MQKITAPKKVTIFDFKDYREFLISAGLPDGMYSHTVNNLQNWAKRLGYKSPSSLTMVLKGQRFPSQDMARALTKDLKLNKKEEKYFKLLIQLEKSIAQDKDHAQVLDELNKITKTENSFKISLTEFNMISDWYHIVIKQLIATNDFLYDINWIHRRLRKHVSPNQIRNSIKDLIELGLVEETKDGSLKVVKQGFITTNDIPSNAIRNHHSGMITQALKSINEQDVNERQLSGNTLKIKKENLPEAKTAIFEFLKEFNSKFGTDESSDLYQLNIQLFSHTTVVDN